MQKDNSVSNSSLSRSQARKQPGIYMIRCTKNDKRYYGESKNVAGRLASHRAYLRNQTHSSKQMQKDFDAYGEQNFEFIVLYMGPCWTDSLDRQAAESQLIMIQRDLSYNILDYLSDKSNAKNPFYGKKHREDSKKAIGDAQRGVPKNALGKTIFLDGEVYPSLAEASRITGHSRKTIRKRANDPNDPNCYEKKSDETSEK